MKEILKKALTEESDILCMESFSKEILFEDGDWIKEEESSFGAGLRIFEEGKIGIAWTKDKREILDLKNRAKGVLFKNPGYYIVPEEEEYEKIFSFDEENIKKEDDFFIEELNKYIKNALKVNYIKKVLYAGFDISKGNVILMNSTGMELEFKKTVFSFFISLLGEKNGEVESGGEGKSAVFLNDIDFEEVFEEAINDVYDRFGGKSLEVGKYEVVFSEKSFCSILSLISGWFLSSNLEKNLTPLKGKEGKLIGVEFLNIINDGIMDRGIASSPFDAEGVKKRKMYIVQNGRFIDFLYDLRRAKLFGKNSTGSASRLFSTLPHPNCDNIYIEEGDASDKEIFEGEVFYIKDLMGLHLVDPVNLIFSFGATGVFYEKGRKKYSVRGVTVSGNLLELLSNIVAIGDKIKFYGKIGSPKIRVKEVWVAG